MSKYARLKKVTEALDWSFLDEFSEKRRRKVGRKGSKTSVKIKVLLIQKILGIPSDRQMAEKLKASPTLRRICGLRRAPHHSTLSKWRKRIGIFTISFLFYELVKQTKQLGITKGRIIAIDSTDFSAYCNPNKKKLSDSCATWGYSATKGWVFGYKAHIAVDAETELPLAVTILPANEHDATGFFPTFRTLLKNFSFEIKKILGEQPRPKGRGFRGFRGSRASVLLRRLKQAASAPRLFSDCGYDATEIYEAIRGRQMKPVIAINGRGHYESIPPKDKDYRKRVAIERVNSRCKEELGLDNLKMRGLWGATIHVLTVLCSMLFAAIGSFKAGFKSFRSIISLRY